MKRINWIIVATLVFCTSCSVSNEERAEKLIKKELNKVIVNIDTYEPIETVVDSAFAPMITAGTLGILTGFPAQIELYSQLQNDVSKYQRLMSIYERPYDAHSKVMYNQYKEEYESAKKRIEDLETKITDLTEKLQSLSQEQPYFNGYIVRHQYRYVDNNGNKTIGKLLFLMDKDFSTVDAMIDLEDEDFKALLELIETYNFGK